MRRSVWLIVAILAVGLMICVKQTSLLEPANDDVSSRKAGDRMTKTVDGVEYAFRWCPPGKFTMGSPKSEWEHVQKTLQVIEIDYDETQHEVTLTRGFWMLETEVTQAMWQNVMDSDADSCNGDNLPVRMVSWDDCQHFCRKLSRKIGMKITLPTEAQWEYACRAGTDDTSVDDLDAMGWYAGNSEGQPHPAGQKQPNAWCLYDMHGNVSEWCQDWFNNYPSGAVTNPIGTRRRGSWFPQKTVERRWDSRFYHINRGGCWLDDAEDCRSTYRSGDLADVRLIDSGFRVVSVSK